MRMGDFSRRYGHANSNNIKHFFLLEDTDGRLLGGKEKGGAQDTLRASRGPALGTAREGWQPGTRHEGHSRKHTTTP